MRRAVNIHDRSQNRVKDESKLHPQRLQQVGGFSLLGWEGWEYDRPIQVPVPVQTPKEKVRNYCGMQTELAPSWPSDNPVVRQRPTTWPNSLCAPLPGPGPSALDRASLKFIPLSMAFSLQPTCPLSPTPPCTTVVRSLPGSKS